MSAPASLASGATAAGASPSSSSQSASTLTGAVPSVVSSESSEFDSTSAWSALISSSLQSCAHSEGFDPVAYHITRLGRQLLIKHFNRTIIRIVNHLAVQLQQQQNKAYSSTSSTNGSSNINANGMLRAALTAVCPNMSTSDEMLLGLFLPSKGDSNWKHEASRESAHLAALLFQQTHPLTPAAAAELKVSKRLAQWIDYILEQVWSTALHATRHGGSTTIASRCIQYVDSQVTVALYGDSNERVDGWAEWSDFLRLNAWNAEKQDANAQATEAIMAAFAAAYAQANPNDRFPVGSVRLLRVHGPTAYPWFSQEFCPGPARMEEKQSHAAGSVPQSEAKEQSNVDAPFYFYDLELRDANDVPFQFRLQFAQSRKESRNSYSGGVLAFMPTEAQAIVVEEEERTSLENALAPPGGWFGLDTEFKTFHGDFFLPRQFKQREQQGPRNQKEVADQERPFPKLYLRSENGGTLEYTAETDDFFEGRRVAEALLHVFSVLLSLQLPNPGPYKVGVS